LSRKIRVLVAVSGSGDKAKSGGGKACDESDGRRVAFSRQIAGSARCERPEARRKTLF
jgi:hypothetical protein